MDEAKKVRRMFAWCTRGAPKATALLGLAQAGGPTFRDSREQSVQPVSRLTENEPMPTRSQVVLTLALTILALPTQAQGPRHHSGSPDGEQVDSAGAMIARRLTPSDDGVSSVRIDRRATRAYAPRTFVILDSIPSGMRLVGSSAFTERADASVAYSIDGGHSFASSPMEQVQVNGATTPRLVSPDRVTHIRWMVAGPVQSGEVVRAEYQLRQVARPKAEIGGM
jgi:hypothetical protein